MKIQPLTQAAPPSSDSRSAAEARERAIAKLMAPAAQSNPVPNPTSVSPEELSAIRPKAQVEEQVEDGQTDTGVEDTTSEPPKKIQVNPHVELARKEKALRLKAQQQEQVLKQREQALIEREKALEGKSQAPDLSNYVSRDEVLRNPLRVLNELGISYDDLTQAQIDQGSISPAVQSHLEKLQARLDKQDEELKSYRKSAEDQQSEQYKAAVQQITKDAQKLVFTDPEFEMIKATNSVKDVVELIEATFKEEGRLMDVEEAAREVEAHLFEEVEKLTRLEKIKKRIGAQPAAEQTSDEQTPQVKKTQPMKTLTNVNSSPRQLSARERAILAFKGELK